MTTRDMSGRVAIQHAIASIVDEIEGEYGLLSDTDRVDRLLTTAEYVAQARLIGGVPHQTAALVELAATAQVLAEALQVDARR